MSLRQIKRLGQHFLVDPNTIRRIVDQLDAPPDGRVLEIGPGVGALTAYLVERYADFIAIEVDERAVELLREKHPGRDIRHADVLDVDYAIVNEGGQSPLWVIGNLPYNITSQIVFGLLESGAIEQAVLTIQREVAERLVARPRTKAYGILSVMTQLLCRPSVRFHLSPNVFRPKPDVWSSTVVLDWPAREVDSGSFELDHVRTVTRTAFNQRRKTLKNSLGNLAREREVSVPERWARKRAEELEPAEFVELAKCIYGGPTPSS